MRAAHYVSLPSGTTASIPPAGPGRDLIWDMRRSAGPRTVVAVLSTVGNIEVAAEEKLFPHRDLVIRPEAVLTVRFSCGLTA